MAAFTVVSSATRFPKKGWSPFASKFFGIHALDRTVTASPRTAAGGRVGPFGTTVQPPLGQMQSPARETGSWATTASPFLGGCDPFPTRTPGLAPMIRPAQQTP